MLVANLLARAGVALGALVSLAFPVQAPVIPLGTKPVQAEAKPPKRAEARRLHRARITEMRARHPGLENSQYRRRRRELIAIDNREVLAATV